MAELSKEVPLLGGVGGGFSVNDTCDKKLV